MFAASHHAVSRRRLANGLLIRVLAAAAMLPVIGDAGRLYRASGAIADGLLEAQQELTSPAAPEAKAISFLAREVPRWRLEHPCHSCHNNGDAARALLAAAGAGHDVKQALSETLAWLGQPAGWDRNASAGGIDNKPLARIQFAGALASAVEQALAGRDALAAAADLVAADQQPDGSWRLDSAQNLGTPVTYGTALATWAARRTLTGAAVNVARPHITASIARADAWFRSVDVKNVLDASAITLGLDQARDPDARTQRQRALELLRSGQAPTGGWGAYMTSAPESFDTAVAVLALASVAQQADLGRPVFTGGELRDAIARGRRFLISQQRDEGSWPETTRPANQESYAQRISTTGWATMALLASK